MTADRSELLFAVQEAIRRLQGEGRPVDETALATEFDVSPAEVRQCRAALALLEPALPPPRLPDDYELRGELGRGGMGVVYRARQRSLDREVAVKVLRAGDVGGGNFIERFRKEARSLARLRHPHIVAIHEVGETDGCLFYSMDLIAGASLAELIARGEVTPARAVRVLRQVASAIAYSHSHGVIHRDLKPANILINAEGDAFVADFGLARDLGARTDLTVSGQILGTPAYMSPEQARGDAARIGERSDVYALGAILYECLTGRSPFAGRGLAEMVYAVVHEEPQRPRRLNPLAPRELEVICGKAMAKQPEARYATANALLEDLERFHEGRPLLARPPTVRYRVGRLLARQQRALAVGGVLATIVLGAFFGIVLPRLRPPAAATVAAAQELLRAGEPAAALVLAEKAATQAGHERAHAAIASTTLEALLALVRALPAPLDANALQAGLAHLQRARDLGIASQEESDRAAVLATAWPFAGKAAEVGAFDVVDAVGDAVERVIAARRFAQAPSVSGMLALAMGTPRAGKEMLKLLELEPTLRAPADPLRLVAARIVSNLLTADPRGELTATFAARVAREPRLAVPLLELLDRLSAPAALKASALFVKPRELGPLAPPMAQATDLLATLAREGAGRAQATAAEMLAVALDLPLRMLRDGEALVPDAARAGAIATLAVEVEALPRAAGYLRRIAAAVAALDATTREEWTFLTMWLAEHTQARPTEATTPSQQVLAWRQWWSTHQNDDPRAWLVAALRLERVPAPDEAPALLARYLPAPHAERAAWHFLLWLVATPRAGEALPCRPWPDGEPEDLPMAWVRTLAAPDAGPKYCVRFACLRWMDGEREPTLVFEEGRVLHVGDRIEVARHGDLPKSPVSCESPRVPGVQPPSGVTRGSWRVVIAPMRLIWTLRGRVQLVADLGHATWGATHPHVGSSSYSNGMPDVAEGEVAVLLQHELPVWAGGGAGGEQIVCATFEACDEEPQPGTLENWRGVLARSLRRLAPDSWTAVPGGLDWDRLYRAERATEAAKWLPVPEAVEDLARLTVLIPNHQLRGADGFSRNVTRARLLLGDATALDAPDFVARVPLVKTDDMDASRDTRFWAHVWQASTDARVRELATARMHPARLSVATAAAMAAAEPAAHAALPPALAAVVADGGGAFWRARFLPDLDILVASVAAMLVAFAAAFAFVRARRVRATGLLLLVGGLLAATFDVRVGGVAILPDAGGAALAALGACLLARGGRGFWRWLPLAFFGAAAVLGGLFEAGVAPFATSPAMTLAFALAVLSLPLLAYAFPLRSSRGRWVSAALTLAVLGAFGVRAGLVLYNDIGARLVLGLPGRLVLGGPSWSGLQQEWLPLLGMVAALALVRWRARTP